METQGRSTAVSLFEEVNGAGLLQRDLGAKGSHSENVKLFLANSFPASSQKSSLDLDCLQTGADLGISNSTRATPNPAWLLTQAVLLQA